MEFIKSVIRDKRKLSIVAIVVIAGSLALTVFVAQKQQEIRQRAAGEQTAFFFSTETGCSNPVTATTFPPGATSTLNLCLNTNFTGVSVAKGFDVTIAKGTDVTLSTVTVGVDGAKLGNNVFNTILADGSLRYARVDQGGASITGTALNLGTITLTATSTCPSTTPSACAGSISMTKSQVIDQTGVAELTVAKPILPYTIAATAATPTPTPPPGVTITPTPGPSTVTIQGHFVDQDGVDLVSNIGQAVDIAFGGSCCTVTYNSTPAWRQVFWNDSLSPANGYIVTATAIAGYSISYSLCNGCTDHTVAGGHPYINGNSVTVNLPTGGNYADIYLKYVLTSTITPTPTPGPSCPLKNRGDADCDGKINIIDFNIWRDEFLKVSTSTSSDFDNSGAPISIVDFNIWRDGFLDPSLPH